MTFAGLLLLVLVFLGLADSGLFVLPELITVEAVADSRLFELLVFPE